MKNRNISIYIAIGLVGLFIFSFFEKIEPQIITGLSIATLLFTIAQILDSQVSFWNEDLQNKVDVYNNIENFNLSPQDLMLAKIASKYLNPPKKQIIVHYIASVLYSVAFIILFLSFVVPININERIGTSITVLSSSLLFLSIWFVDRRQERKAQWNEVQVVAMLLRDTNTQTEIKADVEVQNGQAENGNP